MKKLGRKYAVLALNVRGGIARGGEHTKIPALKKEVLHILDRDKKFVIPSAFFLSGSGDEILASALGGWKDASGQAREMEKQLGDRKGADEGGDAPEAPEGPETWTNREGKEIRARALSLKDGKVTFVLESGKTSEYPIGKLSPEGQEILRERFPQAGEHQAKPGES